MVSELGVQRGPSQAARCAVFPPLLPRSWAEWFPHCARRTSTLLFPTPPSQWGSGLPALKVRASNEGFPVSYISLGGGGQGCPLLRASNEHF